MAGKNYAKGKPVGDNQVPFYDSPPAVAAVATDVRDNAATSSIILIGANTTAIEVGATGFPAYLKWLTQTTVDSSVAGTSVISAAGTANFDHMIPAASVKRFVLPIVYHSTAEAYGSAVGANIANGLYRHVALISGGVGSVAATQYGSSNSY